MTPLQWTLLCGFFTIYLLFGGTIFMVLEQHSEILAQEQLSILRQDVQEILLRMDRDFYHNNTSPEVIDALRSAKEGVIGRISDECGKNFLEHPDSENLKWNYYNAVFFAFTIVTTIGYGHLSPTTDWSRVFVIMYAMFGIPLNGILLQGLGDYFSTKLVKAHKKSKEKRYESKLTLIFDIIFYLIPGMVIFIVLPAGLFTLIENWPFMDSIYYSFVTLTTIGFGDFVAGMGDGHNVWLWIYKATIIIWILFGLGYLMMILGFIAKGLTHKKVRIVIENRLNNIRSTKEKLSKDVEYMRRVINELYMIKIKPVEKTSDNEQYYFQNKERTQSHPCLRQLQRTGSLPITHPGRPGKRPGKIGIDGQIVRTMSETDLDHIDKFRTFEDAISQCVLPDELLAAVVEVLSHNVVQDVLEAVDELNELEEEEEEKAPEFSIDSKKKIGTLEPDFDRVGGPWNLNMVTEDQEILITSGYHDGDSDSLASTLEEVVIHADEEPNKPISQGLIDKVNTVIRKISTGKKTPSDGPSRKVSRNESDRRRKTSSKGGSCPASRKVSQQQHQYYHTENDTHGTSSNSRIPKSPRLERIDDRRRSVNRHHHYNNTNNNNHTSLPHQPNNHSRKVSEESHNNPSRPMTVETTSLADFLRALDTVHQKLKPSQVGNDHPPSPNTSSSHHTNTEQQQQQHHDNSGVLTSSNSSNHSNPRNRRRKVGVFHPDFSFVNHAFNPDVVIPENETKESSSTNNKKDGII